MLKKLLFTITTLFIFCFGNIINAQTQKERQEIRKVYSIDKLKQLEANFSTSYEENKSEAYQFAQERGIRTSYFTKDGSFVELQGILPDGTLLYYTTFNVNAAISTRANHLNSNGSLGLNLDGQGMVGYVWDGGHARESHQEFDGPGGANRVSVADASQEGGLNLNFHASHVTGTIAASGAVASAKGMAWQSEVRSYMWNNDLAEATAAAANGMLLSNHSYGFRSDLVPDYYFGGYIDESRNWDNLLYNAPYYLMVVAAGNDGNNNTDNASPLAGNAAYDKLTGHSVSKNNLVVANAQDASIDSAGNLVSVTINSGSSEGPTDDYRIKPDITGNGTSLFSTLETSDTAYGNLTGTSMASPNVMGSLLLLQQHANNLYGSFLRSSTLKGLALHTADDIGPVGPDAIHGWGLLNAKKAAEALSDNSINSVVEEIVLDQGETFTIDVTSDQIDALNASISWTDPAGIATSNLNDSTPKLINDLDITVTQNTNTFYPWRLTGVDSNANNADNTVDNFERVDIQNASGTYTITVTHKGNLTNGSQNFSLIVTGVSNVPQFCGNPGQPSATSITDTTAEINWTPSFSNPANGYNYFVTSTGIVPDENTTGFFSTSAGATSVTITGLTPETYYDVFIRSDCSGTPSFSDWMPISFTTTCVATSLPYTEDFENGIDSCWSLSDPSQVSINANCGTNTTDFLRIRGGIHTTTTIPINANGESSLGISFDIRNGCTETSDPNEPLNVEYWNGTAWILIESIESSEVSQVEWEQKNYDISSAFGFTSDFKLRFNRQGGTITFDDLNIDNLSIVSNACSAVIPSNLIVTSITDTSAEINWDSQTAAIYDLRYRESGTSPWIDISDLVASSTNLIGLTAFTEYEVQVRSKCLGDIPTAYSSSIFFTTEDIILMYCDAGGNGASNSSDFEKISNVSLNTIDNNSNSTTGYEDFTSIYTTLSRGLTYPFEASFTGTSFSSDQVLVWIDFNQDGDFEDLGEEVLVTALGFSPWNGNITIPTNASLGETTMRVRLHDAAFGPNVTPCGDSGYGQVEDYTVVIYDDYVHYDNVWTPQNPAGVSTITDDILVVNGNPALIGLTEGNTLSIQRVGSLSVEDVLRLSGDLENDGELTFKSDTSGSGQLGEFNGTMSGLGEVNVERYIPAKRAFRLLASPVTTTDYIYENWQESGSTPATPDGLGTHITGGEASLGFDQSGSNNPSMFTFDNDNSNGGVQTDDWYAIPNTNNTKLDAGEPYLTFVRGDRSINLTNSDFPATPTILRAKGSLYTGPFSPVLSSTPDFYNLIANPYQAVVDYNAVTRTGLTDFIYVWDASIDGANGRGGYVTVELPIGNSTVGEPPSPTSSDADQYLAPGMSFFVQNDSDGATTTSITFEEADKATAENQVTVFSTSTNFYINSRLYKSSNLQNGDTESDAIGLRFSNDFTTLGDSEDATKLFNPGENYAIVNNGLRSIDKQQLPTIGHEIDLNILNYQETNYSLTFEMENKPTGLGVFIDDNYLNTQTELNESFVYDFTVDANIPESMAEDRFSLIFDTTTLSVDENTFGEGFRLYPNPAQDGQFAILTPGLNGEVEVELTNAIGQKVYQQTLSVESDEVNVNAVKLSTGVYIVKLTQGEQTFISKLIVD